MNTRFSIFRSASIVAAAMGTLALSGCSEADPVNPAPDSKVEVPTIEGAVAGDKFCDLATQIDCAGAVGCCTDASEAYTSVAECAAESRCADGLGKVLESPLLQDGTITYDAAAAGDYLRAMASRVASCETPAADIAKPIFLVGSRDEGADCSPQGQDQANLFTCKANLQCTLSDDPATGAQVGVCAKIPAAPTNGAVGDTCASEEDCQSGPCASGKCALDTSYACNQPEEITVPANTDPTQLYIKTHDSDSAGTTGTVTLKYISGTSEYSCEVTPTNKNTEYTCTPTKTTLATSGSSFYISMTSTDGVRISTVCARYQATPSSPWTAVDCAGTFFDYGTNEAWSEGCTWDPDVWGFWCSNVWLDNDGHGDCKTLKVNWDNDNYTNCYK